MRHRTNFLSAWLICVFFASCFVSLPNAFCQDEKSEASDEKVKATKPADPTRLINSLKSQLRDNVGELAKKYRSADSEESRDEVVQARREMEKDIVDELIATTKKRESVSRNVKDLCYFFGKTKGSARANAFKELMENYNDSSSLTTLAREFEKLPLSEESENWISELKERSGSVKVQAAATLTMAKYVEKAIQATEGQDESELSGYLAAKVTDGDLNERFESLLNECVDDFADVASVASSAQQMLSMMNLKIGKIAPDIVGLDLDDREFKLSDYRGKVVVVDFWGDW